MIVLRFLALPSMCYHIFIEQYFQQRASTDRGLDEPINPNPLPCGHLCTYCLKKHLEFTLEFDRQALVDIMISEIFDEDKVTLNVFKKRLAENVLPLYGGSEAMAKSVEPGHIHALALQLFAAGFVEILVLNEKLIGSKKLNKTDIFLKLVKEPIRRRWRVCDSS